MDFFSHFNKKCCHQTKFLYHLCKFNLYINKWLFQFMMYYKTDVSLNVKTLFSYFVFMFVLFLFDSCCELKIIAYWLYPRGLMESYILHYGKCLKISQKNFWMCLKALYWRFQVLEYCKRKLGYINFFSFWNQIKKPRGAVQ